MREPKWMFLDFIIALHFIFGWALFLLIFSEKYWIFILILHLLCGIYVLLTNKYYGGMLPGE